MATQFSGLDGLLGLGQRTDADIRPALLRALTDLYMQKRVHSHDEERHYTELALRLLPSADPATRAAIRQRLIAYGSAPEAVMQRLLADEVPAEASANRVAASAGRNGHSVDAVNRPEAPSAGELTRIFFDADGEERRLILLALHYAGPDEERALPADAVTNAHRLEAAVLKRNIEEAIWLLERFLDITRASARRIVMDTGGEPFIAAAKVIGVPIEVLQRILLFLNPAIGRSVPRVYELARLYEEISRSAASRLVAIWREADAEVMRRPEVQTPRARETASGRHELLTATRPADLLESRRVRQSG